MFLRLLPVVGASVASLWAAALIAIPRKPLPHNEVQELVYARLLGRQHRAILLAIIVTALGFFALVSSIPVNPAVQAIDDLSTQQVCANVNISPPICYTRQPGGAWIEETLQADGTWHMTGVSFSAPHLPGEKDGALDP